MPNKNSNRTPERAEKTLHALFWKNKKSESQLSYTEEMLTMLSAMMVNLIDSLKKNITKQNKTKKPT